jgi:hypothetical protein
MNKEQNIIKSTNAGLSTEPAIDGYTVFGVVFIVTESLYYDESGNYQILKAFKTIESAEKYINELKSSYKGLDSKIWEWEEVELS